jgi:hypothetical protein
VDPPVGPKPMFGLVHLIRETDALSVSSVEGGVPE